MAKGEDRPALKILKGWKEIVGVEIGVQYGYNAFQILSKYDIKTLYLIDPYIPFPSVSTKSEQIGTAFVGSEPDKNEHLRIEKVAYVNLTQYKDKVIWINKFSWDVVDLVPDNLDFVYIDGDHRKVAVERDIRLYYKKVRVGGLIAGHDYMNKTQPGLVAAVNEFFKGKEEIQSSDKDWWCIKKEK